MIATGPTGASRSPGLIDVWTVSGSIWLNLNQRSGGAAGIA